MAPHPHDHQHKPQRRALILAFSITAFIALVEAIGGYLSGSLALFADAGHMLFDLLALGVALIAISAAAKPPDERRTWGYHRLEVIGALINSVLLFVVAGTIAYEAITRWLTPVAIDVPAMMAVAGVGLVANLVSLLCLHGHNHTVGVRSAFLHIVGDTLSSVGVLVGGLVVATTGWQKIDAILSVVLAAMVLHGAYRIAKEVVDVLLEAAPRGLDTEAVRQTIIQTRGILGVHDLHIWSITPGLLALSAHVVLVEPTADSDAIRACLENRIKDAYAITHTTLQIECRQQLSCGGC